MYIDLASTATVAVVLAISFCLGACLQFIGSLLGLFGPLVFAFILAIAGDRSNSLESPKSNKPLVLVRFVVYLCGAFGAFALAADGLAGWGIFCAIASGIALGIALVKLIW